MSYRHLDVRSVACEIGARTVAPCLPSISDAGFAEMRVALAEHQIVFLRDQPMMPAKFLALAGRFVPPCHVPHAPSRLDGHPEMREVVERERSGNPPTAGGNRRSDTPFAERAPARCILPAKKDVSSHGGGTRASATRCPRGAGASRGDGPGGRPSPGADTFRVRLPAPFRQAVRIPAACLPDGGRERCGARLPARPCDPGRFHLPLSGEPGRRGDPEHSVRAASRNRRPRNWRTRHALRLLRG